MGFNGVTVEHQRWCHLLFDRLKNCSRLCRISYAIKEGTTLAAEGAITIHVGCMGAVTAEGSTVVSPSMDRESRMLRTDDS